MGCLYSKDCAKQLCTVYILECQHIHGVFVRTVVYCVIYWTSIA